jgi:hypothetical protein
MGGGFWRNVRSLLLLLLLDLGGLRLDLAYAEKSWSISIRRGKGVVRSSFGVGMAG